MPYGLSATGFDRKTLAIIQGELEAAYKAIFGNDIDTSADSVFGQLIGIHAEREAEVWELLEAVYASMYPDTAEGVQLDNAAALVGVTRLPAEYSEVTATLGTAGGSPVVVPAGKRAKVPATGAEFETTEEVTIPGGGTVNVLMRAVVTGPLSAPAGTLTQITTPVSGWDTVTNADDAILGRDQETDTEFRTRRAQVLVTSRGGTLEAIKNRLLDVDDVTYVFGRENRTDTTDGNGLPPHSYQFFLEGGTDQDIWDALWAAKPAGIETHGDEAGTVTDSQGETHTLRFQRVTEINMWLIVNLTTNADYPGDGDDLVKAALVAYGEAVEIAEDVLNWKLVAAINAIPGITAVEILQGTADPPTLSNNTTINANERAKFALARITVNS